MGDDGKRRVLITGASSGVGLALARRTVAAGHDVVLAVRTPAACEGERERLRRAHPRAEVEVEPLDLFDLDSVRALASRLRPFDVLVANAGIAFEPERRTATGVIAQFAVNHLGHFVLAALALPRLVASRDARIVTVSSTLGRKGAFAPAEIDGPDYGALRAYTQSKLANALFAAELDRRLRAQGVPVRSVLAHPGVPATAMQQKATGVMGLVARVASAMVGRPPDHGARALAHAALGAGVQSGEVWGPGAREGDAPRREDPWPSLDDREGAARLWSRSEALGGVRLL